MHKLSFYILSFTWGLPMTLLGGIVATGFILNGYTLQKWGYCYYIEIGDHWGGCDLGLFFLKDKQTGMNTKNHEHGHAIQNIYWGLLMPFVIGIPSVIRYWFREYLVKVKKVSPSSLPDYDAIWFEHQATILGTELVNNI